MKKVALGRTGEAVSELCLGCMLMGTAMDEASSIEVLDHFLESGGNFIDTANCYAWWMGKGEFIGDESEKVLGKWMKTRKNRSDVFLATKVGARLKGPCNIRGADGEPDWGRVKSEYEGLSASVIRKGIEDSLHRLGTDYIDLYYTHVFDERTPLEETMKVLDDLVREGKVRFIGCSNIATQQIMRANEICERENLISYAAMQQEYSYLHPNKGADTGITAHGDGDMFSFAEESGMAFLAYSPLLKGIYGDRTKREQYYNWHLFDSEKSRKKLDLVEAISSRLGISGNQLVLAWMLRQEPRIIPILGFSRKEQYYENITTADIALSDGDIAELNAME